MFRELRDLIIEGLHLLLLYGFLCVCAVGVIVIFIVNAPKTTPNVTYNVTHISEPIQKPEPAVRERICTRIEGCEVFSNSKTEEGYCPTCVWSR